jgi:uncharacterized membrane protein YuzA (DUF378 family)
MKNSETKKWLHMIAFVLVIIGAIDLGLFGIIPPDASGEGFDLLQRFLGFSPTLLEFVDFFIGLSGIYLLVTHTKDCKVCGTVKTTGKTEEKTA